MNRPLTATMISLLALTLALTNACSGSGDSKAEAPEGALASSHSRSTLDWAGDWESALKQAKNENKPVLVTFYADWCIWCKRLESTTLADAKVTAFLAENVVPVKLDVDNEGSSLSEDYRVDGLPTILVLDAAGKEIGRIPGYLPPDGFLDRVRSFLS